MSPFLAIFKFLKSFFNFSNVCQPLPQAEIEKKKKKFIEKQVEQAKVFKKMFVHGWVETSEWEMGVRKQAEDTWKQNLEREDLLRKCKE